FAPFLGRVRKTPALFAFSGLLLFGYLCYFVFDSWTFLRFLLPAIPLLFILWSAVVLGIVERAPLAMRGAAVVLVGTLVPGYFLAKSNELHVFAIHRAEARYTDVGRAIADELEPNAVVLTIIQSGSVRLYSGRATVRWDRIGPESLDFALKALRE